MLGHRGCRLGISYPEIYEMQARAIFEARDRSRQESRRRQHPIPEIMIPLIATKPELEITRDQDRRPCREGRVRRKTGRNSSNTSSAP